MTGRVAGLTYTRNTTVTFDKVYEMMYSAFCRSNGREPTPAESKILIETARNKKFHKMLLDMNYETSAVDVVITTDNIEITRCSADSNTDEQSFSA